MTERAYIEEQDRLEIIYKGIEFKKNKDKYQGLTWETLNDELGNPYSNGESFRSAVKAFQKTLRNPIGESHEDALPMVNTDEEKIIEIKKEKAKLSTLRIDLNKTIRETARNELLYEEFLGALKRVNKNYEKPNFQTLQRQKDDVEYVLAFGDIHFGKFFKSITNEYSIEIVYENFNELYNQLLVEIEEKHISSLKIVNMGDLIEGMTLRISQIQSVQVGLVDQTIKFMLFLGSWLEKLSEVVKIEYYAVKSSNHSQVRPFGAKPNEFVLEDMERIIHEHLKDKFSKNSRVKINSSDDKFTMINIFDYSIIVLHGHETKNLDDLLKNLSWKYRKFFDYVFVGHMHQNGSIGSGEGDTNNCEVIRVPSMMGTDEYADSLFVGGKAGASLVCFNRRQGKRSVTDIIVN